jgi:hypothetical protein
MVGVTVTESPLPSVTAMSPTAGGSGSSTIDVDPLEVTDAAASRNLKYTVRPPAAPAASDQASCVEMGLRTASE